MKKIGVILLFLFFVSTATWALEEGFHFNREAKPFPTLKDFALGLPWDLGDVSFYGQNRARWHSWDYFASPPFENEYSYYANQLRLGTRLDNYFLKTHAAWQYGQTWLLPSGASAGAGSGALYFANGTAKNETHGTYLKYAEVHTKDFTGTGLTIGGGRMDYSSGNRYLTGTGKGVSKDETGSAVTKKIQWLKSTRVAERLIGGFGWSEYQRSFDGGYGAWDHEKVNVQIAAMNPTQGGFDENANHTMAGIDLLVSEFTIKKGTLLPNTETQLFYYRYADSRQMTAVTPRRDNTGRRVPVNLEYDTDVDMIGGHLAGASELGDGIMDYLLWGGYQYGDWFELNHSAYAVAAEAGYQWKSAPWKPWVRAGYNVGSGDSDPLDGDHGTFYQMLPTARLYSFSILYNMMNTEDTFVSLIITPSEALTVRSDLHWVGLTEKNDRWYLGAGEITDSSAAGYAVRPSGGGDELGTLLDVSIAYKMSPQATLSFYLGRFFGSDVVDQFYTKTNNVNFLYTEVNISF